MDTPTLDISVINNAPLGAVRAEGGSIIHPYTVAAE